MSSQTNSAASAASGGAPANTQPVVALAPGIAMDTTPDGVSSGAANTIALPVNSGVAQAAAPNANLGVAPSAALTVNAGAVPPAGPLQHPDELVSSGDPLLPHLVLRAGDRMAILTLEQALQVRLADFEELHSTRCHSFERAAGVYAAYFFARRRHLARVARDLEVAAAGPPGLVRPASAPVPALAVPASTTIPPSAPPAVPVPVNAPAPTAPSASPAGPPPPAAPTPAPAGPLPPDRAAPTTSRRTLIRRAPALAPPTSFNVPGIPPSSSAAVPSTLSGGSGLIAGVMAEVPVANPLLSPITLSSKGKGKTPAKAPRAIKNLTPTAPIEISDDSDETEKESKKRGKKKAADSSEGQAKKKVKRKVASSTRIKHRDVPRIVVFDDDDDVQIIPNRAYPSSSASTPRAKTAPPPASPSLPSPSPAPSSLPPSSPAPLNSASPSPGPPSRASPSPAISHLRGPSLPVESMPARDREIFELLRDTYGGPAEPRTYYGVPGSSSLTTTPVASSSPVPSSSPVAGPSSRTRSMRRAAAGAGPSTGPSPSASHRSGSSSNFTWDEYDSDGEAEITRLLADLEAEEDDDDHGDHGDDDDDYDDYEEEDLD